MGVIVAVAGVEVTAFGIGFAGMRVSGGGGEDDGEDEEDRLHRGREGTKTVRRTSMIYLQPVRA